MNEMCMTQIYVIIAYLLADREQTILKSIKHFTETPEKMENTILYQSLGVCKLIQNNCNCN